MKCTIHTRAHLSNVTYLEGISELLDGEYLNGYSPNESSLIKHVLSKPYLLSAATTGWPSEADVVPAAATSYDTLQASLALATVLLPRKQRSYRSSSSSSSRRPRTAAAV